MIIWPKFINIWYICAFRIQIITTANKNKFLFYNNESAKTKSICVDTIDMLFHLLECVHPFHYFLISRRFKMSIISGCMPGVEGMVSLFEKWFQFLLTFHRTFTILWLTIIWRAFSGKVDLLCFRTWYKYSSCPQLIFNFVIPQFGSYIPYLVLEQIQLLSNEHKCRTNLQLTWTLDYLHRHFQQN